MFQQLQAIVRNTFVESIRQPIFLVMIVVGLIALVLNLNLSAFTLDDDNKFLLDMGMATIFLCGLLIAAFVATSVLTREIANRTVLTVVSKPVGRPLFIFGKYVGVSSAITVATVILCCAFLLTLRHKVMQTARDEVDWPVIFFGVGALLLSVGIGTWCNFFYGWVFTSTTVGALFPLSIAAYVLVLFTGREWDLQGFGVDFNGQILISMTAMLLALFVMCAVAIAASTRLGQVMTIFVCILVFVLGLMSNHVFGKRAFQSEVLAQIAEVNREYDLEGDFSDDEDTYNIRVDRANRLREGLPVIVSADPLGLSPISGRINDRAAVSDGPSDSRVEVRSLTGLSASLVRVGDGPMNRAPRAEDYLLARPPDVRPLYRVLWSIPPNLQFLILVDPLTQGHEIPLSYLGRIALYSLLYTTATLALAVILFQTREVG